jgi:hypothetical protein
VTAKLEGRAYLMQMARVKRVVEMASKAMCPIHSQWLAVFRLSCILYASSELDRVSQEPASDGLLSSRGTA